MQDHSGRLSKGKPAVVKILNSKNGHQRTGFIVSKKGLVVPADHNVSNASNTKETQNLWVFDIAICCEYRE
jgi:hypothetical protein